MIIIHLLFEKFLMEMKKQLNIKKDLQNGEGIKN